MQKRLFVESSPGMVKAVKLQVCDQSRNITECPEEFDTTTEIPATSVPLDRAVIVSPQQLSNSMNSTDYRRAANGPGISQPTPYAQHGAVTANNTPTAVELASGKDNGEGFETDEIVVVFSNEGAVGNLSELIGDGVGVLRGDSQYGGLGIGAPNAALVIDGTFGTETINRLRELTKSFSIKVHSLHFVSETLAGAPDTSMYSGGKMRLAKASIFGNAPRSRKISVSKQLTKDSYNTNVRSADNFKAILTALDGIAVTVPQGIRFTMTFNITKVSTGSAMEIAQ